MDTIIIPGCSTVIEGIMYWGLILFLPFFVLITVALLGFSEEKEDTCPIELIEQLGQVESVLTTEVDRLRKMDYKLDTVIKYFSCKLLSYEEMQIMYSELGYTQEEIDFLFEKTQEDAEYKVEEVENEPTVPQPYVSLNVSSNSVANTEKLMEEICNNGVLKTDKTEPELSDDIIMI